MRSRLLAAAVVCAAFGLSACCTDDIAARHARASYEVNAAHEKDEALPEEARLIASDNADAWAAQVYILEGGDGE
jgi:hypothetical protein